MTKTEMKLKAQDMIMSAIGGIFTYEEDEYNELIAEVGEDEAFEIVKKQCDRVAKMFGFNEAWYY